MIQFQHTIFSLPFALAGAWLAAGEPPAMITLVLVILAATFARTGGMCVNRMADLQYDALNPRTAKRPLVTGQIPILIPLIVAIVSFLLFLLVARQLNSLSFWLAPLAVALIVLYSFLKRWTLLCHFGIGLVIAFAPMGGWIAVQNSITAPALWISIAVLFWVAGFDIIYSVQDAEFDRSVGLHSIPARMGSSMALHISAICHIITILCLWRLSAVYDFKSSYQIGLCFAALILAVEHILIRKNFNRFVNFSFFTLNGVLSILYMAVICVSV